LGKKNTVYKLAAIIFCVIILSSLEHYHNKKTIEGNENSNIKAKDGTIFQPFKKVQGNNLHKAVFEPIASGSIIDVPWENDKEFKRAREMCGTPGMMAAFCTVLHDPLPGEEYNVHLAARMLCGISVKPGETFSQNNSIGPYTEERGFRKGPTYMGSQLTTTIGGGVCKIASTLYNVMILSNLQVVERHAHSMPVPYVPYGQDATVAYGARDFKFRNNTDFPVMIWAQGVDNILYMAFYGGSKPPQIEWHHEILSEKKAPIVYKKNSMLPPGTEKVVVEGMDGAVVRSWLVIEDPEQTFIIKNLGNSNYSPMSFLIEKGN